MKRLVILFLLVFLFGMGQVDAATATVNTPICANGTIGSSCGSASDKIWHRYSNGYVSQNTVFYVDGNIAYCIEPGIDANAAANAYTRADWDATSFLKKKSIV